jgi:hypothetical protein
MQQHVYCLGYVSFVLVMCSLPGLVLYSTVWGRHSTSEVLIGLITQFVVIFLLWEWPFYGWEISAIYQWFYWTEAYADGAFDDVIISPFAQVMFYFGNMLLSFNEKIYVIGTTGC